MLKALVNDFAQRILSLNKYEQKVNIDRLVKTFGLSKASSVLDFGCGTGLFTPLFFRYGWQYTGYDVDPSLIEFARRMYPLAKFAFTKDELARWAPFDLILMNCCAHHISDHDLNMELREISEAFLSPTGIFVMIDILQIPVDKDSFLHRQFMKLEQGRHVRPASQYEDIVSQYFIIKQSLTWKSHVLSLSCKQNPFFNDMIVLVGNAGSLSKQNGPLQGG